MPETNKIFPNSDITVTWTPSTGTDNYALIDENPAVDTDYNSQYNTTSSDRFGFPSPTIHANAETISLDFAIRAKRGFAATTGLYVSVWIYDGAAPVRYDSAVITLTDEFTNYSSSFALNPRTGAAWTRAQLDGANVENHLVGIGYYGITGVVRYQYVSNLYFIVSYTTPVLQGFLSKLTGALSRLFRGDRTHSAALTLSGFLTILVFEVRTMYVMGDYLYALVGSFLYKIDAAWTKTLIGTIGTTTGKAWIVGDGTNLAIVDGVKGYSWDGLTFAEISFPDSFVPSSLTFQDGYFIVSRNGTGRFYISALQDPTSFDALDYATAEGLHDNLVAVHSHQRDLWLSGTDSLEIWYNSGASTFPFERYLGGFLNIGCKAARSVVSSEQGVFWLDNHFQVRIGAGIQSVVLSPPQIEYQIVEMAKTCDIEDAVGLYYFQKGHGFYQLTIGDKTFVYDVTTKFWHTRATGNENHRHPAQCYAFFNKKHLVGHYSRGHILSLDYETYTNNGEHFKAIRAAQTLHADRKRVFHGQLEIEFESGVGVDASTEPEAILEWSDDGGKTWSNQHTATFGAAGEYGKRCIWRRLGNSRSRIYRVTIDDPVKRVIIGAHLDAQAGS